MHWILQIINAETSTCVVFHRTPVARLATGFRLLYYIALGSRPVSLMIKPILRRLLVVCYYLLPPPRRLCFTGRLSICLSVGNFHVNLLIGFSWKCYQWCVYGQGKTSIKFRVRIEEF